MRSQLPRRSLLGIGATGLAGCAGRGRDAGDGEGASGWSCVPYARLISGLDLRGDAATWWDAAAGRYPRDRQPALGGVLVLAASGRLRDGHVAVVSRLVDRDRIEVAHANWANRGRAAVDQPVLDVSSSQDWSLVRVWFPPSGAFGVTSYPTLGFVHPVRPPRQRDLVARIEASLVAEPG